MTSAQNHGQIQKDLERKTAWGRADSESLAALRPRVQVWQFAENAVFEPDALAPLAGDPTPRLISLSCKNSALSRRNLLTLANLPELRRLDLLGCTFAPDDFAALCDALATGGSPKLSELWLENTALGDDDLKALGKIARLQWIKLSGTQITDEGLAALHGLKKLQTLWLERVNVSDTGVLGLAVLPKLSGIPTRETACSPSVKERFFRAQMEHQKTKKPLLAAQADEADTVLRDFLRDMEAWERAVWGRARAIEAEFRSERPSSNQLGDNESRAYHAFRREINEQKAALAARFCSHALLKRGAGRVQSYGDPPHFAVQNGDWLLVETPSKTKTVFTGEGTQPDDKRRYTMVLQLNKWRLDTVQWWGGGWKSDMV